VQKLLLTGSSGFLGKALKRELGKVFSITTLGRSECHDIGCDLAKEQPDLSDEFDYIIHNAGKAHVIPKTAEEKAAFFQVNYQGTLNLLAALEQLPSLPRNFIFISTIAVYGKTEGTLIDETHPLDGTTPYALSKIQAEAAVQNWAEQHKINYLILRLPLVVGPNPPGNLGAIKNAIKKGRYLRISGNNAKKSVVLAEDVAKLIPKILDKKGVYNLTDGQHPTFSEIESAIAKAANKKIKLKMPLALISALAQVGDFIDKYIRSFPLTSQRLEKMTSELTFSDQKAVTELSWSPNSVISYIENGKLS
jgi:nucleoside-diphosphate-sugar epimerase